MSTWCMDDPLYGFTFFLLKYFAFSNHSLDELELSHFLCKNIYRVEAVSYWSGYIRFVLNWLILILCKVFFRLKWSMKLSIFQVILRERSDPFYYENVQGAGSTLNPQYRICRLFDADLESVKAENINFWDLYCRLTFLSNATYIKNIDTFLKVET